MKTPNRRQFLQLGAVALAVPFVARWAVPEAQAQALPRLPLDHPQAKALAYVEDASKTTHAKFVAGSNCANCQFFVPGTEACTPIPGFSVEPKGWCAIWAKKA